MHNIIVSKYERDVGNLYIGGKFVVQLTCCSECVGLNKTNRMCCSLKYV